jgi:hypothetical protein
MMRGVVVRNLLKLPACLCIVVNTVDKPRTIINTRDILNSKIQILLLWRHVSAQCTILRPSLYVMPTRIESGIKLLLKLLHW